MKQQSRKNIQQITGLITIVIMIITFSGCQVERDEANTSSTGLSGGASNYLQLLDITDNTYSYHLHKRGSGNKAVECKIHKDTIAKGGVSLQANVNDLVCYLEVEEHDLWAHGLNLQLYVPEGKCEYLRYKPYWFFQYQYGYSDTYYRTYSTEGDCSTTAENEDPFELSRFRFIHTLGDGSQLNCDGGSATQFNQHLTEAQCSTATVDFVPGASTINAGGSMWNCANGPGKEDDFVTDSGKPVAIVYDLYETEATLQWEHSSPAEKGLLSNIYLANFTNNCTSAELENFFTKYASTIPLGDLSDWDNNGTPGLQAGSVVAGTSFSTLDNSANRGLPDPLGHSQAYYTWECLDRAHEVKARIRLQVRDWDQDFDPTADYIEKNPEDGTTASLMDTDEREPTVPECYNDRADWDNDAYEVLLPGSYNSGCQLIKDGADNDCTGALINTKDNNFIFPEGAL